MKDPNALATSLAIAALPKEAYELGKLFSDGGFKLALVGGSVRDAILGRLSTDLDFTTNAKPDETKNILKSWSERLWEVGRDFGTIAAEKNGITVEITTYRREKYDPTSRKPIVEFGSEIEIDLSRRDFTVNAMALELTTPTPTFIDLFDGVTDLAKKVLRTPINAEELFTEDPLRMMRAARFAAQLGFEVAPEVLRAMREMAERISIVSAERIQIELTKLLMSDKPRNGIAILVATNLAEKILPEITAKWK